MDNRGTCSGTTSEATSSCKVDTITITDRGGAGGGDVVVITHTATAGAGAQADTTTVAPGADAWCCCCGGRQTPPAAQYVSQGRCQGRDERSTRRSEWWQGAAQVTTVVNVGCGLAGESAQQSGCDDDEGVGPSGGCGGGNTAAASAPDATSGAAHPCAWCGLANADAPPCACKQMGGVG